MSGLRSLLVAFLCIGSLTHTEAASVHVAKRLGGYACMMLNQTPEQATDPTAVVHVYAAPSQTARIVGVAMPVVAIRVPVQLVNGFLSAMFPNGAKVWIPAVALRPYHSLGDPSAKCAPALMSNGLQGFDYYH